MDAVLHARSRAGWSATGVELADGRRAFVEHAPGGDMARWLLREQQVYATGTTPAWGNPLVEFAFFLPPPGFAPTVRPLQLAQLIPALAWTRRELEPG